MCYPIFDVTSLTRPPESKHAKPATPYRFVSPAPPFVLRGLMAMLAIIGIAALFGSAVVVAKALVALTIGVAIGLFVVVLIDAVRNYFKSV